MALSTDVCGTQDAPSGYTSFGGKLSPEADILCHLSCNNGVAEAAAATGLILSKNVGIHVLSKSRGSGNGYFFYPGQHVVPFGSLEDIMPEGLDLQAEGMVSNDAAEANTIYGMSGGLILVRQPSSVQSLNGNRAARLATLVEEIGHALLYHSPACKDITNESNERFAQLFKLNWINRSGLGAMIVTNYRGYTGTLRNKRAFTNCPGEIITASNSFSSFSPVSFKVVSQACVDDHVKSALLA